MTTSTGHSNIMLSEEEELRALELFERRHELTDDELKELAASPVMQDAVLDLMDVSSAFNENVNDNDNDNDNVNDNDNDNVNCRDNVVTLQRNNNNDRNATKIFSINGYKLSYIIAACALALVTIALWKNIDTTPKVINESVISQAKLAEGVVFEQQDNSMGVTLSCNDSTGMAPALQSVGNSVIADFTALQLAEAQEVKMDVPMGYDATVTLPDGSIAYLHPGSRLKFPTQFIGGTRQVILEGECYFKVHHDAEHPFIVSANGVLTTVLGTEFNVTTNGRNGAVVTLISGSVRVDDENSDASLTIVPGQQTYLNGSRFVAKNVDTSVFEAWRDGYICYDNMPMSEVMEAIGRNYNMTVQFANRDAMHTSIRFVCERKASVDDAIALINSLRKANVKRHGSLIVVE